MNVRNALKFAEQYAVDNSPTLLSGLAVTGTLVTTYLTGKATFKAADLITEENERRALFEDDILEKMPFGKKEKALLVWKCYVPPALSVVTTVACIVTANSISSSRLAALAAAYKISDKAYAEYKEKVLEQFGEKEEQKVRDSLAQDRVDRHPSSDQVAVQAHGGDVLCFDPYSARYFRSDMESLRQAQNSLNESIYRFSDSASLTEWYDQIGLQSTKFSDEVGWDLDNSCQLRTSTTLSDRNEPCIVVDFGITPFPLRSSYPGAP